MILGTGKNTALNPPSQKLVRSSVGPPDNRPGNSKCMKGTRFEICLFFCRATFWRLPEDLPNISPPHFIQKVGPKMYFFFWDRSPSEYTFLVMVFCIPNLKGSKPIPNIHLTWWVQIRSILPNQCQVGYTQNDLVGPK